MACEKLHEVDTTLTADSVEWCPCDGLHNVLASGTYQLDEKAGLRRGALSVYEWNGSRLVQLLLPDSRNISDGILDMKWHSIPGETASKLALALSSGAVSLKQLDLNDKYSLVDLGSCIVAEHDGCTGLCLSLDWRRHSSDSLKMVVSDSLGCVSLVELGQSGLTASLCWKAHQFEAWIVACGFDDHTVYSGGDDCRLCQWDTRERPTKPSFTSKRHTMGVCSLQAHPENQHLLSSGSYDELMYVWDVRKMSEPLKECKLGGGVWRIKWCPLNPDFAAAACMHNGFQIVRGNLKSGGQLEVVASYSEHKSLAYGVDWCRLKPATKDTLTLASCSFYDHSLHIWNTTLP